MPSPDAALGSALRDVKTVTGFVLGDAIPARTLTLKADVSWSGTNDPFRSVHAFDQASGSLPDVEAASAGVGALNLLFDSDGKVRRMPLVFRLRDKNVPSLDAEVLRLAEGKSAITLKSDDGNSRIVRRHARRCRRGNGAWRAGNGPRRGFLDRLFRERIANAISPASALADKSLAPGALRDAIVFIGAPDDLVDTPTGLRPVAEVHAEATEDLLLGTVLRRPASAEQAELFCLALFGLGCVFIFARLGVRWAGLFVACAIGAIGYVSWRLYAAEHVLFDALGLDLGLACVWLGGAGARSWEISRLQIAAEACLCRCPAGAHDRHHCPQSAVDEA